MKELDPQEWRDARNYTPEQLEIARQVLLDVRSGMETTRALRLHPQPGGKGYIAKHLLVAAYQQMVASGEIEADADLLGRIRMKPMRTLSGVTTVTVLTKPYPCPGDCIFCPTDVRMPKSYLPDEPGAARAFQNQFDPYNQVNTRIREYAAIGHPNEKIELLILGGTFSSYPRRYQEEFVQRCFDAMNQRDSSSLEEAQRWNETANHRNVGLVVETRPDEITPAELAWLRRLGVTKVQMGAQSLDDHILTINRRKHTVADTLRACSLLRAAGFKIVLHWMPNLLGATPDSDRADFNRLWQLGLCPDELKIYPTQLLESAELYQYWQRGEYSPYDTDTLVQLIADLKPDIPPYCRVNRIIRDIPSYHVVEGNRRTSLRQDVLAELQRRGQTCGCIRCHEVRGQAINLSELRLEDHTYTAGEAQEHFLHFRTADDRIAGYLRLSLPTAATPQLNMPDLENAALIREVHVYGQSLQVGSDQPGAAQHIGLGTALLEQARQIARQQGYARLAVIAAIGTRRYYQERGFRPGELYLIQDLDGPPAQ